MTDEKNSLYGPALEAFNAGKVTRPERSPTLRPEETYVTEKIYEGSGVSVSTAEDFARELRSETHDDSDGKLREVADFIETQQAKIERLRLELEAQRAANHEAMWQDTLTPLAEAANLSLMGPDGNKRQFQMVDDLVVEIKSLRNQNERLLAAWRKLAPQRPSDLASITNEDDVADDIPCQIAVGDIVETEVTFVEITDRKQELNERIVEWQTRTSKEAEKSVAVLLEELRDLGFSWDSIARLVHVSVTDVRNWHTGGNSTGLNRRDLAAVLAACKLIEDYYVLHDVVSWFETTLHSGCSVTPIDIYVSANVKLLFKLADGGGEVEDILDVFKPDWRDGLNSRFEVFIADDSHPALRTSE